MQEQEQPQVVKHKSKGRPKGLRKQPDGTWVMMSPDAPKAKSVKHHNLKSKHNRGRSGKKHDTDSYNSLFDFTETSSSMEFDYGPSDEELRQLEKEEYIDSQIDIDTQIKKKNIVPAVDINGIGCDNSGFTKALYYVRPIVEDYESALNCKTLDSYKPITMQECLRQFSEIDVDCSHKFIVSGGIKTFKLNEFVPDCYTSILYQDINNQSVGRMLWCVFDKGTKLPIAIVAALRCGPLETHNGIIYNIGDNTSMSTVTAKSGVIAFIHSAFKDRLLEAEKNTNLQEVDIVDYTWQKRSGSSNSSPSIIDKLWCMCNDKCGVLHINDRPSQLIVDTYKEENATWNDPYETSYAQQQGPVELPPDDSMETNSEDEDDGYYLSPSNDDSDFYDQFIDSPVRSLLRNSDEVFYPGTDKERDAYEGLSDGGFRSRNMGLSDDIDYQQDY